MRLTWYGTAALVLRQDETAIAFDPFCAMPIHGFVSVRSELPYEAELRQVTDVFATHGHFDHICHIPRIYRAAPLRLRCTKTPRRTLLRHGIPAEQMRQIRPGDTERVGPFAITAYPSRHCRYDLKLVVQTALRTEFFRHPSHMLRLLAAQLEYPERGEILFYEITCGQARIQIMGSCNLDPRVDYPTGADLLVLPFQGRSDLDQYAWKLVRRLRPKAVVLDHYDDAFPPVSSTIDTGSFEHLLREREGIACRSLEKGEEYYVETEKTLG